MRVWPLIIFLIVECTIPEFPEQGQSGYEQLPSWLKGWYHLPFQLLRVITPGILWFNLRLYKPLTARCESASDFEKCEKSKALDEIKWKTDWEKKRLGTFANVSHSLMTRASSRLSQATSCLAHALSRFASRGFRRYYVSAHGLRHCVTFAFRECFTSKENKIRKQTKENKMKPLPRCISTYPKRINQTHSHPNPQKKEVRILTSSFEQ